MNRVCAKCNPITLLVHDPDGNEVCFIHGDDFVLEIQPDSPFFDAPVVADEEVLP